MVERVIERGLVPADATTAVVTDTTAYLPDELIAEHGIHRVSLYVTLEGEQRPEIEIPGRTTRASTSACARATRGRRTSQPSVGDFIAVYEPLLAEGSEIVSIHLSAGISGTCESAEQARERLIDEGKGGERIHVFDSRSAAGGQGLVVLAAANAAGGRQRRGDAGEPPSAAATRSRCGSRSTRSSTCAGAAGSAPRRHGSGSTLKIKPILTLEEEITPVERVRTRAAPSSGWSSTPASATPTAPTPGSSSTSRTPRRRATWSRSAATSSAASRSSCPRSARSSAPMPARDCSASERVPALGSSG